MMRHSGAARGDGRPPRAEPNYNESRLRAVSASLSSAALDAESLFDKSLAKVEFFYHAGCVWRVAEEQLGLASAGLTPPHRDARFETLGLTENRRNLNEQGKIVISGPNVVSLFSISATGAGLNTGTPHLTKAARRLGTRR